MTDKLRAALEVAAIWHEAQEKALSKQPPEPEKGWRRLEHQEQVATLRAALAAAPQPAAVDREALVEVIEKARWDNGPSSSEFIADALLARGLRLPSEEAEPRRCAECDCEGGEYECTWIKLGPDRNDAQQQLADLGQQADRASETMAWAVVGKDGKPNLPLIFYDRAIPDRVSMREGERVASVAIRVVEGGE